MTEISAFIRIERGLDMTEHSILTEFRDDLGNYSPEQLRHISQEGVWSIGQMYDHLLLVAHEYLDSAELCESAEPKEGLEKSKFGGELFERGGFPPIKIRLPDEMNAPPNNADSKEELIGRMDRLIERMDQSKTKVEAIDPNRKARHGGFGWLNAKEWHQLVVMHFQHHVRQKAELENAIK